MRPTDWPSTDALELEVHDLPHASSTLEWWYLNAHVETDAGKSYSLFASFFRMVVGKDGRGAPIHSHSVTWALSDVERRSYVQDSVLDRCAPEVTRERLNQGEGTRDPRLKCAWLEVLAKNRVPRPDRLFEVNPVVDVSVMDYRFGDCRLWKRPDRASYGLDLLQEDRRTGAELVFTPLKPMVRHGADGQVVGSSAEDMFYYFTPRCGVEGRLLVDGAWVNLRSGQGWYDHEFGRPADESAEARRIGSVAWNWASIQLANGYELSAYDLLDLQRGGQRIGHWLILVDPSGRRIGVTEFSLTEHRRWTSTRTFNEYPVSYRLEVPEHRISLELEAAFDAQEFETLISPPAFWEGRVTVRGNMAGQAVDGLGFVERSGFTQVDTQEAFFAAVGRQTARAVESLLPASDRDPGLIRLMSDEGHDSFAAGLDLQRFHQKVIAPIRDIVTRGGKAWRSYALLAAMDLVGGDSQRYEHWLALPEILHSGSLIIDDVQDRSEVRRGGPTAHRIHGEALAINAGCAAFFLAQLPLRRSGLPPQTLVLVYDAYFEAMRAAHAGQAMDIAGQWPLVPQAVATGEAGALEKAVLATHRLKSGIPPANLARIAALIHGASPAQVEAVGGLFESYGTAFQIVDDVLNLRGFQGALKTRGEDLHEGKITAPVAKALGLLPPAGRARLWALLQLRTTEEVLISEALELVTSCGALEACEAEARGMVEEAWRALDPLVPDSTVKIRLRAFGWYLLERHY